MAYSGETTINHMSTLTGSNDLSSPASPLPKTYKNKLTNGTGAGQAQKRFSDTRTLAASASENLDLYGGLTDDFGATINFAAIKEIIVHADAGNTNNVEVGGAASNAFTGPFKDATDIIALPPGATLCLMRNDATGWAVTSGTGDILKVANSGGTTGVTYDIILVGE